MVYWLIDVDDVMTLTLTLIELANPPIGHPSVDIFNERNGDDRNFKG